jgi:hypothetical protein
MFDSAPTRPTPWLTLVFAKIQEIHVSLTSIRRWWVAASNRAEVQRQEPKITASPRVKTPDTVKTVNTPLSEPTVRESAIGRSQRIRSWRRQVLMRKGARLYSSMQATADAGSLAMLDEDGLVVASYERAEGRDFGGGLTLHRHLSQLYVASDVALGAPVRDLSNAAIHGVSTQKGWRRSADGTTFWATTVIEPVVLRDGRVQGFSLITRRGSPSGEGINTAAAWPSRWLENFKAHTRMPPRREPMSYSAASKSSSRSRITQASAAMLLLFAIGAAPIASAANTPANARANAHGSGWECEHGFRRSNDACAEIALPANAYLDSSGNRWRCDRGYLDVNEACVSIKVPANAYLDDSFGSGWSCERGYREKSGACSAIQIPAHAHAVESSVGSGWECERGYLLNAGACEAVAVPAHGFLTRMGDDWKCERGFVKSGKACVAIQVPANAHLDMQGNSWACARGFRKNDAACIPVRVPANAHLDYSGSHWRCNRGFRTQAEICVSE